MIDEEFIKNMSKNPFETGVQISDVILNNHNEFIENYSGEDLEAYLQPFGLFQSLAEANAWHYDYPKISLDISQTIRQIVAFFSNQREKLQAKSDVYKLNQYKLKFEKIKSQYNDHFGKIFFYEVAETDAARIKLLLGELREFLTTSKNLVEDQRSRLLKRLEKCHEELNHHLSDLDLFWGLIGDTGVVLGQVEKEAKTFMLVHKTREILLLVWKIQAHTENLPEGTPQPLLASETETEKRGLINSLLSAYK